MHFSWKLPSVLVLGCAVLGLGCEPAPQAPKGDTTAAKLANKKDRVTSNTLLYCEQPQDGSFIEIVRTASGGYEAATVTEEYDPWDCRCTFEKRTVFGQYTTCRVAASDPHILNCYRVEPNGSIGKVVVSTTRNVRTQTVIGSSQEVTYTELNVALINQDPGHTPRQDFNYDMGDCITQ
ncbi:hypothetical protein JGU66_18360 [Myxococcaceae bacterium JPH2]|nr:hypothetical protein [Myxococcaceae bacterium JPH2]